jgi:hypothetical protein
LDARSDHPACKRVADVVERDGLDSGQRRGRLKPCRCREFRS